MVDHDPNNAEGYLLLGNVLLAQKHLDDALSTFSKAIALKPDDANGYLNRGAVYAFQHAGRSGSAGLQQSYRP